MRAAACLGIVFLGSALLRADTVELRNGASFEGEVVSQTRTSITVRTAKGIRTVSKADLKRIRYDDPERARAAKQRALLLEAERKEQERKAQEQKAIEQKALEQKRREQLEQERVEQERKEKERIRQNADLQEKANSQERTHDNNTGRPFAPLALVLGAWEKPFVRGALVPGWGQAMQGREFESRIFGYGVGGLVVLGFYFERQYQLERNRYLSSSERFFWLSPAAISAGGGSVSSGALAPVGLALAQETRQRRDRMQTQAGRARLALQVGLLLYAGNLADLAFFSPAPGKSVFALAEPGSISIGFTQRWESRR